LGYGVRLLEEKKRIVDELKRVVGEEGFSRAKNDHHAKRSPRPCGMTIHTAVGCRYRCVYCYIYDMGFPGTVSRYPLQPLELALALALNPYVVPRATFAAYGAVTEPFVEEVRWYSVEVIQTVNEYLALPSQVSTKSVIDDALAQALRNAEPRISVLVTLVTIDRWKELEPYAPNPIERIEGMATARRHGLHVTLFLRPLIPTVIEREAGKLLKMVADAGIDKVVLGTLRVTPSILARLRAAGVGIEEIERRLPRKPRSRNDQVTIRGSDIKKIVAKIAQDYGFKVFESACAANVDAHGEFCSICDFGPCGVKSAAPPCNENDVRDLIEYLGYIAKDVDVYENRIRVVLRAGDKRRLRYIIEAVYRRRVEIV